jgi:hypothetical protein
MTKIPINYSNTIIYKIVCNDLLITDVYIGSTTDFVKRKYLHKSDCNNEKRKSYNQKIYVIIRENGGWFNWSTIEVEKFPSNDNNECRARERYWYEVLKSNMNSQRPFITEDERNIFDKEYKALYYFKNKTFFSGKNKEYYELNKSIINEKTNCLCGGRYTTVNKQQHLQTKKHISYLAQIKENHLENEK